MLLNVDYKELHATSTHYRHQIDGQTEAFNKYLKMCNTSYQTFTQMTPFKILHGRQPPTISSYIRDSTGNSLANSYMLGRDELLKHNLGNAQK